MYLEFCQSLALPIYALSLKDIFPSIKKTFFINIGYLLQIKQINF